MANSYPALEDANLVLVFGSQILDFDEESANRLRSTLLDNAEFEWILQTILDLRTQWTALSKAVPALRDFPGISSLEALHEWLRTGSFPPGFFPLSNIILTPLVVISHLCQYSALLQIARPSAATASSRPATIGYKTETLGLCTGLLSAAAISSSTTTKEFEQYGAAAIRMAMAIGALIDAKDRDADAQPKWRSLTVGWTAADGKEELKNVLQRFPEAYVSVLPDERRATLSLPRDIAGDAVVKLRNAGLSVVEISLRGSFHNEQHGDVAKALINFFDSNSAFQFPDAADLVMPTRSNAGGDHVRKGLLHHEVARSMIIEQSNWQQAFTNLKSSAISTKSVVVSFGSERCIPTWLARELGSRLIQITDLDRTSIKLPARLLSTIRDGSTSVESEGIAVVGLSCQLPGAPDLEGFWDALCAAKSQHQEVPADRFEINTPWRGSGPNKKWFGNFLQDYDTFDHKFFKKSPREMSSTDPQHRLMLQVAYQAVEQSGYFNRASEDRHIGCYIGVGLVDYENNVAGYPATAYTATGNLKSFAAGKISHHFGWTGPGLTIDTACSSSAVAIHQACKAILAGECSAALVGGVNVMSSPEWFQNLAGASFLSPTGQCKPFDVNADGYCRGEAVGAAYLKPLSAALRDGNQIFGVIAASGVYQNQNCTAITVPNALSLSDLFRNVTREAGLEPEQISVVEAHGTGTQVGDPAEYDGVRQVFGATTKRAGPLSLGSVKGLLGHSESASGIVALLKTLLMINKGAVPPQASYRSINPAIKAVPADNIEINTSLKPWDVDFRAALINNYGASGSNASLVITQAPISQRTPTYLNGSLETTDPSSSARYPFWFTGFDETSLQTYASKFLRYLKAQKHDPNLTLANLSFQVSQQSNRSLGQSLIFSCSSIQELEDKLAECVSGNATKSVTPAQTESSRPVILCFGGQISTFVGLEKSNYDNFQILRHHLDAVNDLCLSLGLDSIYPAIFEKTPIEDPVKLQTTLFAMQYACAQSWMDCGVPITAVVGHSFGELSALWASGTLSLKDTLRMIAARARIIKKKWGADKGSMMAVEADLTLVQQLLSEANHGMHSSATASIACFNGPRSFTLAGPVASIEAVQKALASNSEFSSIKSKVLDVTNSFHSTLVDALMPDLEAVGRTLIIRDGQIQWERATKEKSSPRVGANYVATHMREPVYFHHAVERLHGQYPSGIWLEAGSNSTITVMASRALGSPKTSQFHSINITGRGGFQSVTDATVALWKEGLNTTFWMHHPSQTYRYSPLLLPPYQFEKSKHWLELKKAPTVTNEVPTVAAPAELPKGLWTFVGYLDDKKLKARFRINTMTEKYQKYVSAHIIAKSEPICPSTFQLVIAIEALTSLEEKSSGSDQLSPALRGMDSHSPMIMDASKYIWLDAQKTETSTWSWKMISTDGEAGKTGETLHVSGEILFRKTSSAEYRNDFAKYERLVDRKRCLNLLDGGHADSLIQGSRNIYKSFADIVHYKDDIYHGLRKLAGTDHISAGRIIKSHKEDTWLDLGLADTYCQVAGIYLNTMTDLPENDMFISTRIDQWFRSPKASIDPKINEWEVFALHHRQSDKECVSDVFAFDAQSGQLVEVILGVYYVRTSKNGMAKLLSRLAGNAKSTHAAAPSVAAEIPVAPVVVEPSISKVIEPTAPAPAPQKAKVTNGAKKAKPDIAPAVRDLICNLSGLEPEDIKIDSDLVDLGIDSLMGMELARELDTMFSFTLDMNDLMELTDFQSLLNCIHKTMGVSDEVTEDDDEAVQEPEKPLVNGFATHEPQTNGYHVNGVSSSVGTPEEVPLVNGKTGSLSSSSSIPASAILAPFAETKIATDKFITDNKLSGYAHQVLPRSTELCVVHILDGFEQLGCSLRDAKPGQVVERIKYLPRHEQFVDCLYDILEKSRVVDLNGSTITRTNIAVPTKSAAALLQDILRDFPDHTFDHKLTFLTGCRLADCLTGEADGLQLIFGSPEGREVASGMYGKSPINVAWIKQMESFLTQFMRNLPKQDGPLKILEMGAGTGGTTARLIPLLDSLGVPFQYTVTDLASSLVAAARKRFKQYKFMEFKVVDIEKEPPEELLHSQHLVVATNCVHATHNLMVSTKNIHNLLRPDGFLMMLEMTEPTPWIDLVFGLVEGWWLFDDGRKHALAHPRVWEEKLKAVGYGHVDWTDGQLPEAAIQRIIIALAAPQSYDRVPIHPKPLTHFVADTAARQGVIDGFIDKYSRDFTAPVPVLEVGRAGNDLNQCVLITGATGSLGSHLVAHFASLPDVSRVICVNRRGSEEAVARQHRALESRGLVLDATALSKLKILETDTSKPALGLPPVEYAKVANAVTHIIHNAWPMSITRSVAAFEPQMRVMRNLIDLARESACRRPSGAPRVGFQLISSIATVGHYPLWSGQTLVPEAKMTADSVLPTGYGDAKLVCERLLDETLHRYPDAFRPMVVRIAQIAGSKTSGYWNPVEHLAFLIKSSQTVKALPNLQGDLSWCPVNDVAASLGDLLLSKTTPHPIYHIENPARQSWQEMLRVLAEGLDVPQKNIIPFAAWLDRVRQFPPSLADAENPAARLAEFLDGNFERMSCGDLVLDTAHSREHSVTMRNSGPVGRELTLKYIQSWKDRGFLHA